MALAVENRRVHLAALFEPYTSIASIPLCFGLGAGLHFEYLQRPSETPSRFIIGLNRNLQADLSERVTAYQNGNFEIVRDALRENAFLFNLDRAPTTALLGMEMLAEQLPEFEKLRDGRVCLQNMAGTISESGALYRSLYAEFLEEISIRVSQAATLKKELQEIATEWNLLAAQLQQSANQMTELERASSMLRRLAFREEHFWGKVLDF